jgi:phosphoribosyl 1,2-cyclic phosphodiesterase
MMDNGVEPTEKAVGACMHEVDFWKVSISSKSADAISMRFIDPSTQTPAVVVIDGGFASFGDELAANISSLYGTDVVDLAISTHPDADHINGLPR